VVVSVNVSLSVLCVSGANLVWCACMNHHSYTHTHAHTNAHTHKHKHTHTYAHTHAQAARARTSRHTPSAPPNGDSSCVTTSWLLKPPSLRSRFWVCEWLCVYERVRGKSVNVFVSLGVNELSHTHTHTHTNTGPGCYDTPRESNLNGGPRKEFSRLKGTFQVCVGVCVWGGL
jgi:hypothetical protein